jgi:hypothetical protein
MVDSSNKEVTSAGSAVCIKSRVSISASVISSTIISKPLVLTTGVDVFKMGAWLGAGGGRNNLDSSDSGGVPANSS